MTYIKYIIASLSVSLLALPLFAAGGVALILQLKQDGAVEKYVLTERPVLSFDGEHIVIKNSTTEITTNHTYAEVERLFFDVVDEEIVTPGPEPEPDAVDELPSDENRGETFEFVYDGRNVAISGIDDLASIAVYTLSGVKVQPTISTASPRVTIALSELPRGVYIIRAGNRSIKIKR